MNDNEKPDYIYPMDFVRATRDVTSTEDNDVLISNGELLFISGAKAFPLEENDPYTQRVKFFVHKMNGDDIDVEGGLFVVDPFSLVKISKEENERLYEHALSKVGTSAATD